MTRQIWKHQGDPTTKINGANLRWFEKGRFDPQTFMKEPEVEISNSEVMTEWAKHQEFANISNINSTPTILFDGRVIPKSYSLDDVYQIYK